jgi:hypothetical protein
MPPAHVAAHCAAGKARGHRSRSTPSWMICAPVSTGGWHSSCRRRRTTSSASAAPAGHDANKRRGNNRKRGLPSEVGRAALARTAVGLRPDTNRAGPGKLRVRPVLIAIGLLSHRQACPHQVTEPGNAHQAAVLRRRDLLAHRHLIPPGSAAAAGYDFVQGVGRREMGSILAAGQSLTDDDLLLERDDGRKLAAAAGDHRVGLVLVYLNTPLRMINHRRAEN